MINLKFIKINDNLYRIINLETFKLNNIYIPFKISKFYNNYYLNLEFDENTDFINYYENLEKYICNLENINLDVKKDNLDFYSNIKVNTYKNKEYKQIRTQLQKTKNKIITNYKINNLENNIFNLVEKKKYNFEIIIYGLWIKNNKYGLIIYIKNINLIDK